MFEEKADAIITGLMLKDPTTFDLDLAEAMQSLLLMAGASEIAFSFSGVDPEVGDEGRPDVRIRFDSPGAVSPRIINLIQTRLLAVAGRYAVASGRVVIENLETTIPASWRRHLDDEPTVLLDIDVSVRCSESSRYAGIHIDSWAFHRGCMPDWYAEHFVTSTHGDAPAPEMG